MSEQDGTQAVALQRPATIDDQEAWKVYWEKQGQPWRTEAEIDLKRQEYLVERRSIPPDVRQGVYPFKGIKLSRADVEWLLETHENGRGPVDYGDESQRQRRGIDLRGADLRRVDLQNLPLACTIGDVAWREWPDLTEEQHTMAAVLFEKADLKGAHLEGADLEYACFEGADLRGAYLEAANLAAAHLERAYFEGAHLEGTDFWLAHLDEAFLWATHLGGASLREAHLQEAHLDRRMILVNKEQVGPHLVDAHLGEVNLALVNWSQLTMLGDEYVARQKERDGVVKDEETRLIEYEDAVRANRQLAVVLQAQGLYEDAGRFAYRAQLLQRIVLRRQKKVGQYLFSGFLDLLAGYGYRPERSLIAYVLVLTVFALAYAVLGRSVQPAFSPLGALVFSVTSFHGRGFFPGGIPLDNPITVLAALEAVIGLMIEISFIATFTQRFFGK